MKRVLITGTSSYLGSNIKKWLKEKKIYEIDDLSLRDESWKKHDFSQYNVVIHVAGIAHSDIKKIDEKGQALYYEVNRDLTIEVAKKAKAEGIGQFIFTSSIIVYGESAKVGKRKRITRACEPAPANFYGESKWQAEKGIERLQDETFNVVILRLPMIYGKGAKGNYDKLARLASRTAIFPKIANERSMLYIDFLCEFVRLMIDNEEAGIFFPQNEAHVATSELVQKMRQVKGRKVWLIRLFNPLIRLLSKGFSVINKVFGNLSYDLELSAYKENYRFLTFEETIRASSKC